MDASMLPLKIVLIEDNQDFAFLFTILLENLGHVCISACDGIEGIKRAEEIIPDIIFCDIGLPLTDGFEVAKKLKEGHMTKEAYLVALTGYASQHDVVYAAESGFDFHLAKPVDIVDVKKLLDKFPKVHKHAF